MIWKDRYCIGVELIDEQHKELFTRVSSFVETLRAEGKWEDKVDKVNETLSFMQDYVVTHFRDEEEYQRKIGYPALAEHCEVHTHMVDYVLNFAKQYEAEGYREELVQQFAGKLLAWLINHVAATDQKIGQYSKGGEQNEQ